MPYDIVKNWQQYTTHTEWKQQVLFRKHAVTGAGSDRKATAQKCGTGNSNECSDGALTDPYWSNVPFHPVDANRNNIFNFSSHLTQKIQISFWCQNLSFFAFYILTLQPHNSWRVLESILIIICTDIWFNGALTTHFSSMNRNFTDKWDCLKSWIIVRTFEPYITVRSFTYQP